MRPRVSFVVTLYNKARYLPQVWAGLRAQTGAFGTQYVFVDDGSTDDTVAVLRRLSEGVPDVLILQQANGGPAKALNAGLTLATGDVIKLVDGDDVLLPWCTAWMLEALEQSGAHAACGFPESQRRYIVAPIAEPKPAEAEPPRPKIETVDLLPLSLRRAQTMPSLWLVRRSALLACGGCDGGVFIQDYSLELRLAAAGVVAVLRGPLVALPEAAPGRLSDNQAQTLHDLNLAALRFMLQRPTLSPELRWLGVTRALGRAYLWSIRRGGLAEAPRLLLFRLLAALRLLPLAWVTEPRLCHPFRVSHPIRVPAAGASQLPLAAIDG